MGMLSLLPYGPTLKPLISHSTMSDADMRAFLNMKGIFLSDYSRENVVPLLEVTLITPKEFNWLKDKNKNKEDKVKRITKNINIENDFNLVQELSDFTFDSGEDSDFKNYSYIDKPELTEEDSGCVFEYRIKRYDRFKSWNEQETEHKASVVFKKRDDQLIVEAFSEHTADETKGINERLINHVKKHLVEKKLVQKNEKIFFIKYDDFNNHERLKYILQFRNLMNPNIQLESVADVIFAPDGKENISESEISWMEDKVSKLKLTGKKLDEIDYFENEENYKYIIIESMKFKYKYKLLGFTGEFSIDIGFFNIIRRFIPMTEFQYQINSSSVNEDEGKKKIKLIEKEIAKTINSIKQKYFDQIISLRK